VSDGKETIDQDALAAEWGLALEADAKAPHAAPGASVAGGGAPGPDSNWAGLIDDGSQFLQAARGGAERILNQEEIDSLLGFSLADVALNDNSGIRAIIDSGDGLL
jgi:flagellar motor switch protein FliM